MQKAESSDSNINQYQELTKKYCSDEIQTSAVKKDRNRGVAISFFHVVYLLPIFDRKHIFLYQYE